MKKMDNITKVLIISPYYWSRIGGVEYHSFLLYKLYSGELDTFLVTAGNTSIDNPAVDPNITIKPARLIMGEYPLPSIALLKGLYKNIKNIGGDGIVIIQGRHFISSVFSAFVCAAMKRPYIYIEHGLDYSVFHSRLGQLIARVLDILLFSFVPRWANRIVCVHPAVKDRLLKHLGFAIAQDKIRIIENSIKIEKRMSKKEKIVVFAARNSKQKNNEFVLDQFFSIHKQFPEYKFYFISNHISANFLNKKKEENLLIKNELLPRQEFLDLLSRSTIYINASSYEGLALSVLEAAQLGNILVLSDIPENKLKNSGVITYYFSPNNVNSFQLALRQALKQMPASVTDVGEQDYRKFEKSYLDLLEL